MKLLSNDLRDQATTAFRYRILERLEITPLVHQAQWHVAADGGQLLDALNPNGVEVLMPDMTKQYREVIPRLNGRAHVIGQLGSFKTGKSFGAGLFAASFGCVPNGRIALVGAEYDMCEPEFQYITEFLLSERGMNMKYDHFVDRPRDGKMWLDLKNGCRFECKSWERKDSMKGKEIDLYCYCEAYMLPGMECLTDFYQNLKARRGYAIMPTTPDRPWLKEIHVHGHAPGNLEPGFEDWECICDVDGESNPYTFDLRIKQRDEVLMTSEKYAIHHLGKLGQFVGSVYRFQRGERRFSPLTHPHLFDDARPHGVGLAIEWLRPPTNWTYLLGVDTGTFMSALLVAIDEGGDAFVIAEFPNYHYRSGQIELDEATTTPTWTEQVVAIATTFGARATAWADMNSQFKKEVMRYGLTLVGNKLSLEKRTDTAREYFQHNRIWLAPWLSVLPFELENAKWPEEATSAGKFGRIKDRDHTLDCLEHVLSRRPLGRPVDEAPPTKTWAESFGLFRKQATNPHLGSR